MYNFLVKNGQLVAFGVGILITVLFLGSVIGGISDFEMMPEEEQVNSTIFNIGLSGAMVLTVVAAIAMLVFGLIQVFTNLKGSVKGLLGAGVLLVLFFIGYSAAGGNCNEEGMSEATCQMIGGGIITALALVTISALAFVVSEVSNFFK